MGFMDAETSRTDGVSREPSGNEGLSRIHRRAWIAFYVSHGLLSKRIDRSMREAGVVPMDVYDLLLTLEIAPNGMMKQRELEPVLLLTRSGISRMIDRMEAQGLVARSACPTDKRATHVVITQKGLAERERAWEIYRAEIVRLFADKLSTVEADQIYRLLGRILEQDELDPPEDWLME